MSIGFDFDKIFIDYPPFFPDFLFDKFYKKKTTGELLYRIPAKPEQLFRRLLHVNFLRPLIKENVGFLKTISKTDNKLYLVSSRFKFLEKVTHNITRRHGFDNIFDNMYFNFMNEQPHVFKNRVLKELKLDKYVDDDLQLLKYIASRNNHVKLYWLNKKINKKVSPHISAITKLSDIFGKSTI